MPHDLFTRVAR